VTEDDQTSDPICGPVEAPDPTATTDPVADLQVATLDPYVKTVASQRDYAVPGDDGFRWRLDQRLDSLSVHAEWPPRARPPGYLAAAAGAFPSTIRAYELVQ
jgi:hypothetical protein